MPNWYIQRKDNDKFLQTINNTTKQTKYIWVDKLEEATNFRYRVSMEKAAKAMTRLNRGSGIRVRLLCKESTGKIFEVAKIEIEE